MLSPPLPITPSSKTTARSMPSPLTPSRSGSHILSQKVARALQVQTDTPAMTAALEALSSLDNNSSSVSSKKNDDKKGKVIDARSVRAAIEQDALQQAILFQTELQNLVQTVTNLRESVTEVKDAAGKVSAAIEADVVCTSLDEEKYDNDQKVTEQENSSTDENDSDLKIGNTNKGLHDEEKLSRIVSDAFRARNEAAYRAETVKTFLEKFDLSDSDNYLLDHYAFEEFSPTNNSHQQHHSNKGNTKEHNGPAFLQALKRVRNIREQLKSTFDTETFIHDHNDDIDNITDSDLSEMNPLHPASSYSYNRLGATSALRMMETLASKQERAYERLYNWLQSYLRLNTMQHVPTSSSAMNPNSSRLQRQQSSNLDALDEDDLLDEALAHPFVNKALMMLNYMPAYYNHILELIAMQRRSEVTRRFLLALTSGYNGMTPIEMKAHDPVNYVGDMLAFIFRAFSVECDLAQGIFNVNDNADSEEKHETLYDDNGENSEVMTASSLLSHALSGVTRPLKSRISQVVASLARRISGNEDMDDGGPLGDGRLISDVDQDDTGADIDEEATSLRNRISALFSICGLLLFYTGALEKAEGKLHRFENITDENEESKQLTIDSSNESSNHMLIESMQECLEEAAVAYAASIRVYAAMLESFAALTSNETESSLANTLIAQIADVRLSSPGFSGFEEDESQSNIKSTLSVIFLCDTLIEAAMSSCNTIDDIQSLKNSLMAARKAGLTSDRYSHWEKIVHKHEEKVVEDLIKTETDNVLYQCGLGSVWEAFQRVEKAFQNIPENEDDNVPTSLFATQPDLSQPILEVAMKDFYSSLYSPPFPSFHNMKDQIARKNARVKTASNVADAYRRIYEGVHGEKGGYEDLSFLGHHPDQVKTLLSL